MEVGGIIFSEPRTPNRMLFIVLVDASGEKIENPSESRAPSSVRKKIMSVKIATHDKSS